MYSRAYFSHKELHKKNREDMHNMLYTIDKNWATDLTDQEKNGTFILSTDEGLETVTSIQPTYISIDSYIGHRIKC